LNEGKRLVRRESVVYKVFSVKLFMLLAVAPDIGSIEK
jgi:hypothetical protein